MSNVVKLSLVATVTHEEANRKGAKLGGVITKATVKLSDGLIVAGATLGGRYTAEQVLSELRRNPSHFKRHVGYPTAKLAGLVP